MPLNEALLSATLGADGGLGDVSGPWAGGPDDSPRTGDGAACVATLIARCLARDGTPAADPGAVAGLCRALAAAPGGQATIPLADGAALVVTTDAQADGAQRVMIHRAPPPAPAPLPDPSQDPSPAVLQQVIDAIPAAISIKDHARRYLFVNHAWEDCYGVSRHAIVGKRFEEATAANVTADTFRTHAEDVGAKDDAVLDTGIAILNREETFVDGSGRRRTWLNSKIPMLGDRREFGALLSITLDITARKGAELALAAAKAEAEHANHLKTEFLSIVSHELRTPLNAILGFTELCRTFDAPAPMPDYLRMIEQAAGTLAGLIEDVLDLSRIELGRFALHDATVPVRGLIDEVMAIARPLVSEKDLALEARVDDAVPAHATGDQRRLRQILVNLVNNAIKFTPRGRVGVACTLGAGGDALVFEVSDTGIGIPPDQHARIFEPFTQVESAGSHGGLGLGLSISRRLVEQMGGRVGVDSRPGRGSRFWFTLPLRDRATPAAAGACGTATGAGRP